MKILPPSFSVLLNFLLLVFMVLKIGKKFKSKNETSKLPPGPWKLPIIGNLHQFAAVGALPHRGLRELAKKYGPFMHLQLGENSNIVVSSPEFAEQIMKIHDITFASRPYNLAATILSSDDVVFSPYGDYWRRLRKICTLKLFSVKRVQSFQSMRQEEMSNIINLIASKAGSVINLTEIIFSSTYGVTSKAAFGQTCKDKESFIELMKESSKLLTGFNIADLFPSIKFLQSLSGIKSKMEKLHQESDRILENIINEHKMSGKSEEEKDLVDVLLKVQENGGDLQVSLTTENIKAIIFDIFSAGSETSSTITDWAMCELIRKPILMKKVQAEVREVFDRRGKVDEMGINEMKFLKLVVKETLRLHPPPLLPRESSEKCEINGFIIPAKTKVIVNTWAIGRDPNHWNDPESFIPERFLDSSLDFKGTKFEYLPFGSGRRMCPGSTFGLANVELSLAMFLYYFDWKLPGAMKGEDLDMSESFCVTVRRKDDLCLIPTPYHPSPVAVA